RPALALGGFAEQLRDLMLRATERGIGPEDLVRLGREHAKPEWVAAGRPRALPPPPPRAVAAHSIDTTMPTAAATNSRITTATMSIATTPVTGK
uniref:hypothetical protein n=1 Tax=Nocardia asiatica TaxID=209252 RepID=UPI0024573119